MNTSPCLRLAIWGDRYKTNDIFTWFPRLPPTLFYKTTWHPDPDMVVIWRHQSPIFLVWRDGLQDRQEASQDEGRRRAETTPHQNSQPRAGGGFHSEGSRKPKGGLGQREAQPVSRRVVCVWSSPPLCAGRTGEGQVRGGGSERRPERAGGGLCRRLEEEGRRGQGWRLLRGEQERGGQQDLVD